MSAMVVTVTGMQVAVKYQQDVSSLSTDTRPICRPICLHTHLGRYFNLVSVDMSAQHQSIYRLLNQPSVSRYVDRYIGLDVHKIHMIQL